jgi:hypothetical protein
MSAPDPAPDPTRADLTGVARDAQTLRDVLARIEPAGYRGQFSVPRDAAPDAGTVECLTCRKVSPAQDVRVDALLRLEGASDPDDMLAVAALVCPNCGTRGSLVVNYGPLGDARRTPCCSDFAFPTTARARSRRTGQPDDHLSTDQHGGAAMSRIRRTMWWMGTGAALAYMFDPEQGSSRRAHAKETIDDLIGKVKSATPAGGSNGHGSYPSGMPETVWTAEPPRATVTGEVGLPGSPAGSTLPGSTLPGSTTS